MIEIEPDEREIYGASRLHGGKLVASKATARIEWLTRNYLTKVADSEDGWSSLYRDPRDGRLWELSYPDSSQQGGGAPRLAVLSQSAAQQIYRF